jgi:hypothetical protein
MYPRFAFALLFSVCAFGLGLAIPAFPEQKCGANAVFKTCGSACVPDCAHPEEPKICTLQCVIGCFCQEGFLKNAMGECVRPQNCEAQPQETAMDFETPQCPNNEEFLACGSACAPTCANPHPSPICTKNCVIGCFCKSGHLRNKRGLCVPAAQCNADASPMFFAYPPEVTQCKENEVFLPCGSACAPTCANPHPSQMCTLQCVVGCFCKPGYLKNEHGMCVPSVSCGVPAAEAMPMPPQMCGDNEEFRQCKGCDGTCDNPTPMCPRICIQGCACKSGHLRTGPNGKCIMPQQCPKVDPVHTSFMMLPPTPKCGENEVFHSCGTACPATCANPHPSPVCTKQCVIGCFCKEGFLKNANGACVPAANCEAPQAINIPLYASPMHEGQCASDREVFSPCGEQLDCLASCNTPLPFLIHGEPQMPRKCLERKCTPGCVCQKPYLRHTDGRCVEVQECQHVSPFTTPSH